MKYFISVLVALFAVTQCSAFMPAMEQYREVCIQETKIDPSKLPNRPPGQPGQPGQGPPGPPPEGFPEPSQELKCFMSCVMEKSSIVNAAGELQTGNIPSPPGAAAVNFDSCKSVSASDKCEKAWQMSQCIMRQFPRPPMA